MKKIIGLVLSLILIITSTPLAVNADDGSEDPIESNPSVVKIGFLRDASGPIGNMAAAFDAAALIAESHINSMQSQYSFEIEFEDSGCDYSLADNAAETLALYEGVEAVAGAACSGASMAANSVLSDYGIPQVSYASTNSALSDDSTYPGFMRVVSVDGQDGMAISYLLNSTSDSFPAVIHYDGLWYDDSVDSFIDSYGTSDLCTSLSFDGSSGNYDEPVDFTDEVDFLVDLNCDSVVIIAPPENGWALVDRLRDVGFSGSIIGSNDLTVGDPSEYLANPNDANGVKLVSSTPSTTENSVGYAFEIECNQDPDCSTGIYVREAYDSIRIIAEAYVNASSYSSLEESILAAGVNWPGASGYVNFLPNGDAVGNGYDICEWVSQALSCTGHWDMLSSDLDGDGWDDSDELVCSTDPSDAFSMPIDSDADSLCDFVDWDDDNDGHPDTSDWAPLDPAEWADTDGDGIGDNSDFDDDGDSWADIREVECGYDPLSQASTPPDFDLDNECDEIDYDDDNDGHPDTSDWAPLDPAEWADADGDGLGDNADMDDDEDGWSDVDEISCGTDSLDQSSAPVDTDGDRSCDAVDGDDDNDGHPDTSDWAPLDPAEWADADGDGLGDNADMDDDEDGWSDVDEISCGTDSLDQSSAPVDTDGDRSCDAVDGDDDNDGHPDTSDWAPLDPAEWADADGDGLGDNADMDDDNDGHPDTSDWAPLDPAEWADADGDGLGDNADMDDDEDGWSDVDEISCGTDSLDQSSAPVDTDGDRSCDAVDEDDDNDLLSDILESSLGTNPLDADSDGDGYSDSIDDLPSDPSEWIDSDNDGTGDNSDVFPNLSRYQSVMGFIVDLLIIVVVFSMIGVALRVSLKKR
ncbi:MAG: ABC transporter substrate-binding protein [Candidatus Thalassarchaeaceae archaeon]